MAKHRRRNGKAFWKKLPPRAYFLFSISVFFTFSIFGFTTDIINGLVMSRLMLVVLSFYTGILAVSYAYTFTRNLKMLPILVILQIGILLVPWQKLYATGVGPTDSYKLIFDGIGIYIGVIMGYIFFIIFIGSEGIKQVEMQAERELATEMHNVLVPPIKFENERFGVYGVSKPALEIGGDLIELIESENYITCYVADVSGHGIDASLLMGMFKTSIHSSINKNGKVEDLVNDINKVLFELKKRSMFITCGMLRLYSDLTGEFLTAGHLPIFHYSSKTNKVEKLLIKQIPISVQKNFNFVSIKFDYLPGDIFVLISDGIMEVMNKNGEQFGLDRVESLISQQHTLVAEEIYNSLTREIAAHGKQEDDQSVMIIKVAS